MFRSDTSRSELAQLAKQANPDEIDIDDDEDDDENGGDEEQGPEGRSGTPWASVFNIALDDPLVCQN